MALLNPSFENPGTHPGEAEHWTLTSFTNLERIAGFGPDPYRAWEDFERWFERLDDFDELSIAIAYFDLVDERHEDFEEGWLNDIYLHELPMGQMDVAVFGGFDFEDMENGWSNVPYAMAWYEIASVIGQFDGESREDFEEQWRSNQLYAWTWGASGSQTAMFDSGVQGTEDFENDWTAASTI
jgi:hypothetical protein